MFDMRRSARLRNKQYAADNTQKENVILSSGQQSARSGLGLGSRMGSMGRMGSIFTNSENEPITTPPTQMDMGTNNPGLPQAYPTPPNAPAKPTKLQNYAHILKPGSCEWVMCLDSNDNEYFLNLKTRETTDKCTEFFSNKMQQREVCIVELNKRNKLQKRQLHRYKIKEYEEELKNGGSFNPEFEYEKGDKLIYSKNMGEPPRMVTVVDVHYDIPRFYTIQYNESRDVIIEKNTTAHNLHRLD
jgi:hypothetical protein